MEWKTVLGGWELYRDGRLVATVYAQFTMDGVPYFVWGARGPHGEVSGWERTPEEARKQAEAVVRGEKV